MGSQRPAVEGLRGQATETTSVSGVDETSGRAPGGGCVLVRGIECARTWVAGEDERMGSRVSGLEGTGDMGSRGPGALGGERVRRREWEH